MTTIATVAGALRAARNHTDPSGHRPRPAKTLASYPYLHELMKNYQVKDLVGMDQATLLGAIADFERLDDADMEGFSDASRQHPLHVRFHWGHRHNFGTFSKPGRMGNHHLGVIATFIDELHAIDRSLAGMRVLDVGCWTGGTALLLAAMGAEVVAIEEIRKYAECAAFLGEAFGVRNLDVRTISLFDCTTAEYQDSFDYVLFAGVLHHLSDPKLALRVVFNCLKDGGRCLLETLSLEEDPHIAAALAGGDPLPASAWNWMLFTPQVLESTLNIVGFEIEHGPIVVDRRTHLVARRKKHVDVYRSGLARREVR